MVMLHIHQPVSHTWINFHVSKQRLCCGAPKGTAASALQNECGELPLHLRRLQNSIKFGAKILGSKFHPFTKVMENHWTNVYRTSDSREHSIYTRTSDFFS